MSFCFATCIPQTALIFINKMYPKHEDLTKEDIPLLYDLIKQDILRVQDPDYHQPCQIIAGREYKKEYDNEIAEAIKEFQNALEKKKDR